MANQGDREYDHRTAGERVNSRLDVWFGLERHTIRGLKKMRLRAGFASSTRSICQVWSGAPKAPTLA